MTASETTCTADAVLLAREHIRRETRGSADADLALWRLARRSRLPHGLWWSMKYRPPKRLDVEKYAALLEFHLAERAAAERRRLAIDSEGFEPRHPLSRALLRAARALAGEEDRTEDA